MPSTSAGEITNLAEFAKFIPTRRNWATWKKDVASKTSKCPIFRACLEFGSACAKGMICEWQKASSKKRSHLHSDISQYPASVWTNAKSKTKICSTLRTETNGAIVKTLGSVWHDWRLCKYDSEEDYDEQTNRIRQNFMIQVNLCLCEAFVTAIYGKDYREKASPYAEMLRNILVTDNVKKSLVLDTDINAETWLTHPENIPCIIFWAQLTFQFEGVADIHTSNLLKDLQAHFPSARNANMEKSCQQFDAELRDLLEPYIKTFTDISDWPNWIRLCSTEIFIECKAAAGNKGYVRAREFLLEKRAFNTILTEDLMQQAVKLAEETNSTAECDGDVESSDEVSELRAMLTKQSEEIAALKADRAAPKSNSGDNKGNGRSKKQPNKRDLDKELQHAQAHVQQLERWSSKVLPLSSSSTDKG